MRTFIFAACLLCCSAATAQTAQEHYERAVTAFNNDDFYHSLEALRLAYQKDSVNPAFYVLRGRLEQRLYSGLYAIDFYEKAIAIDSTYAEAYIARGAYYYDEEQYEACLADYATAIRVDPSHASAYYVKRGLVFEQRYSRPDALLSYKRAIQLDKTCAAAYFHRAQLLFDSNTDAAQRDYELSFRYAPTDSIRAYYRFMRAETERSQAYFEEAYADYKAVLDVYPDRSEVLVPLADVAELIDSNDQALGYYFELLKKPASDYDTYRTDVPFYTGQIALLYRKKGLYATAIDYYYKSAKAFKAQGDDYDPDYSGIAYCELKLGKYDDALKHLEAAMSKWIPGADEYLIRAELYGLKGEKEQACSDLDSAADEYPTDEELEQIKEARKRYCD